MRVLREVEVEVVGRENEVEVEEAEKCWCLRAEAVRLSGSITCNNIGHNESTGNPNIKYNYVNK